MAYKRMIGLAAFVAIAAACGSASPAPTSLEGREAEIAELAVAPLEAGEKLRVIATTNIVAHVVSRVGGDAIELTALLPIGADPHTYLSTPQDVTAAAQAHLIFANGAGLEADFLPELIRESDAPVIYVSQGIEFREFDDEGGKRDDEHQDEGEHLDQRSDPHTWTAPANVVVFVENVERALGALDPAHAETYRANAKAYQTELEALDEWVMAQTETIPPENRKLVTDHVTFGYYADRYGLQQIGAVVPGFNAASQPSAKELAALEDIIRQHGVRAVFVGTTVNPSLAEQVAEDTGVQLVTLYTGSLGPEGSGVETYVDYVCYNTTAIVKALGGTVDVVGSPCED